MSFRCGRRSAGPRSWAEWLQLASECGSGEYSAVEGVCVARGGCIIAVSQLRWFDCAPSLRSRVFALRVGFTYGTMFGPGQTCQWRSSFSIGSANAWVKSTVSYLSRPIGPAGRVWETWWCANDRSGGPRSCIERLGGLCQRLYGCPRAPREFVDETLFPCPPSY